MLISFAYSFALANVCTNGADIRMMRSRRWWVVRANGHYRDGVWETPSFLLLGFLFLFHLIDRYLSRVWCFPHVVFTLSTLSRHWSVSGVLHRLRLIERLVLFLCRVGGRIEKERVHGELFELHVFRSPYLYRRTFDLLYFTADFPPIFWPAGWAANLVSWMY